MDRRRAAGLLLALAACFATATAAPTASNHTALDLYDGAPDGCYYNFQHYGEGDRIMTNEPCLNCTCHNRMLMCYLRVCPFTKPIGQDCTIEKRADQCCPIVTCPDVPVDLLTSTTTSPAEYGPTGIGKLDKYGCSINGKYFSEGSKVPPTPNKPCEHCYCIRNMTTCVMQECTLHVDGCTPIYHKDVCCPVRYSCDHPEDEMPLLDDLSTTVRPTPGFLLTTTTVSPVTQMSQDCVYDNRIFPDGALIKTEKACDHCYCMKGDIVCVVQECGTPMENEGKNCTALPPREGICCPDTYICEGDEPTTGTFETDDFTTHVNQEILTTLSPPRRTSSEGSGYRNEPDEIPYTKSPILEPEIEGSGEDVEPKQPDEITTEKHIPELTDDNMYDVTLIPTTTTKSKEGTEADDDKEEQSVTSVEKTTEPQKMLPITTTTYSTKDLEAQITEKPEDIGSGELPQDINLKPNEDISVPSVSPEIEQNRDTTEENIVTPGFTDKESFEVPSTTNVPFSNEEKTDKILAHETDKIELNDLTTSIPANEQEISVTMAPVIEEDKNIAVSTESTQDTEEITTKDLELLSSQTTSRAPILEDGGKGTTESIEQNIITSTSENIEKDADLETQRYPSSTNAPIIDEEFVTTETQELPADRINDTAHDEHQHSITSTPMLEEIEKDTTQFNEPDQVNPSDVTRDDTFNILSTTISNIPVMENEKDVTESVLSEEYQTEEYQPGTTKIPISDLQEQTTVRHEDSSSAPIDKNIEESSEQPASTIAISVQSEVERKPTTESHITDTVFDIERHEPSTSPTSPILENEEATTEPDKGLNTIPSEAIEEGIPVSPDAPHHTTIEQKTTTEPDLSNKVSTEPEDVVSPTISDESISKEEKPLLTTESVFETETDSSTEALISSKLTTVAPITEKTISTLIPDYIISTGSISNVQDETDTTELSKVTEKIEESTSSKESSDISTYVTSTSEIVTETPTVSTPVIDKDTTTVNQEDNEILNEPRIPGEGDCLLNGVTYTNESVVPSSNKCQSGCKCISSIIKCDPIICSPPPEYMNNCETTYDTPDACCPTYICDHKTETIPPQSHSQMSGTEAPVIPVVQCHGDECEINKVQEHHGESTGACKSGNCVDGDDSKEGTLSPENIPEKPIVQKDECVGSECKKNTCADEKCQVTPVLPCEGDNCEQQPDVIIPPQTQQCAYGEDCSAPPIPAKECIGENCAVSSTQSEDSDIPKLPEEECKGDHCRRKDQHIEECTTGDCKSTQISEVPPTEQSQDNTGDDKNKDIIETTDKSEFETPKEQTDDSESSNLPETSEVVTKPSDVTENDSLVTVSGTNELVTKSELEKTTTHPVYQQESTSGDLITDKDESFSEMPQTSISTDSTRQDLEDILSSDKEIQVTDKIITTESATETERTQEFETTEKSTSIKMSDATERGDVSINEQETTEPSSDHRPGDETSVPSKERTESFTIQAHEVTKPSFEVQDETNTDFEGSTEEPKLQDDNSKPDISKHTETTTLARETITEPSKISSTETYDLTGASEDLEPTKITDSIKDYEVTEYVTRRTEPTSVNVNELDYTKTVTEPTQYDPAIVSATTEHLQSVTIFESTDTVSLPKETEHKDTPMDITEKTVTEPTKPFITESIDDTKSSEGFVDKFTTQKVQTEIDSETKSPEEIKDDSISVIEPQTTETYTSETKTPEQEYYYETTSKTEEKSSSEPSKIYDTTDEAVTEPPVKLDVEHSTQILDKESSGDSVTEPQNIQTPEEVDQKETITERPDKSETEPNKLSPIEEQEDNKTPIEIDQENITDNIIDDFVTESSTSPDVKPNIPIISEEDKTTIIGHDTEPLSYYTTESQDVSVLHEHSIETTVKSIDEIIINTPKTEEEKYASIEPVTEQPNIQSEISRVTTSSPEPTKLEEITIQSSTQSSGSPHKETDLAINNLEAKPTESDIEPIIQEDIHTTPSSIDYNIPITAATSGELDQKPVAESTQQSIELHSIEDVQTTVAPVSKAEEVSQQSEEAPSTVKDVSHVADPDEFRTTPSETPDQTTSKSVEVSSESPQSEEVKTEYPEFTSVQNTEKIDFAEQETSTEEMSAGTEKLITPVEFSTEKSITVGNVDSIKEAEPSQTSSNTESLIQESSTEEIVSKYSSPEPTSEETETPKVYLDENTVAPEYHDSKTTDKPIDDLIPSLVTESYDKETKLSDLEKESQTQTPQQISSIEPDNYVISTGTKQKDDKPAVYTEYDKPVEEVIGTETPSYIDKIESYSTTEKQQLTDGSGAVQEPSEKDKETKTTTSDQKPITDHTHRPVIDITTEVIDVLPVTENKEFTSSEKPSIQEESTEFSYTTKAVTESIFDITKVLDIQTQTEKSETVTVEFAETQSGIGQTTVKPISEDYDFSSDDHKTTVILETTKTQSEVTTLKPGAEAPFFVPTTKPKQESPQAIGGSLDKKDHTDKIEVDSTITPVTVELTTEHLSSEQFYEKEPELLPTEISVDQFATTMKQLDTEIYQTTSPTEVIKEISTSPSVTMVEHATILIHESDQKPLTEKPSIPFVITETEKMSTSEESITVSTEKIMHASDKPIQETTAPEEEFLIATSKATTTKPEDETSILYPSSDRTAKPTDISVESYTTTVSESSIPLTSEVPLNTVFGNIATSSEDFITPATESIVTKTPENDVTEAETLVTKMPIATEPKVTITSASESPSVASETQTTSIPIASEEVLTDTPIELSTRLPELITVSNDVSSTSVPEVPESPTTIVSKKPISDVPEEPVTNIPIGQEGSIGVSSEETSTSAPEILQPVTSAPELPEKSSESTTKTPSTEIPEVPVASITDAPETTVTNVPEALITSEPELDITKSPELHISKIPEEPITSVPEVDITKLPQVPISSVPEEPITSAPEFDTTKSPKMPTPGIPQEPITSVPEFDITKLPEVLISGIPEEPTTSAPEVKITKLPELPVSSVPEEAITSAPEFDFTKSSEESISSKPKEPITTSAPEIDVTESPKMPTSVAAEEPITREPEIEITKTPKVPISSIPEEPSTSAPEIDITKSPDERISSVPEEPHSNIPEEPITTVPKESISSIPEEPITSAPGTDITKSPEASPSVPEEAITVTPEIDVTKLLEEPASSISDGPITSVPEESITSSPDVDITKSPVSATASVSNEPISSVPEEPITSGPEADFTKSPVLPASSAPEEQESISKIPEEITSAPEVDITKTSESPVSGTPEEPISRLPEQPITNAPEVDITKTPKVPTASVPETPIPSTPEAPITNAPETPATAAPELPKPVSTEAQPTDEALTPDEEGSFPPSGGTSGYGQEPDYVEEDQTFGPGTCRYGGKVYVSAQQIPRDDPCDFCFCFRSDIICLQQSCPPPIHGCHEEPIQGFCCPRYECPVSMATTVNVTTTTTTTTTTLPPHFPTHSYKGSVQKRGCQIKGQTYKVGEVVRASSGPCLHCTCGGDGQMKCDPKVCTPEPMLRQMIAAAVSAKRRR